ncbi:MAG: VIT1/CCC1 transporter family protein, partial [Actinobacteria bacterium]|nr:VIT1/CCC1 transporter family protein [Actinomycetota bacterium]
VPEVHHRDVSGGTARAAVFGVSDGLVSNMGLILGVAGAGPAPSVVRLAGLAGLIAGGISMAAGEYNSMKVQKELFEYELEMERVELVRNPHVELVELSQIYESRGLSADQARELAAAMMEFPELALETHAREELGINPKELGSPMGAATYSLVAFSVGAVAPLIPWFVTKGNAAIASSVIVAFAAALVVGLAIARFTARHWVRTTVRQVLFTLVPAGITYLVGSAVGVQGV